MKNTLYVLICLIVGLYIFVGCDSSIKNDAFSGEYVYKSKSGQVECLTIRPDGVFCHELYSDEYNFLSFARPLLNLSGRWTLKGEKYSADLLDLKAIATGVQINEFPGTMYHSDLGWIANLNGTPAIILSENDYYWLKKIAKREDIRGLNFQYRK